MVTVGDVAEDCARRLGLPLVSCETVELGIVETRWSDGIYVHPASLAITLREQTARTIMFDPTRKTNA